MILTCSILHCDIKINLLLIVLLGPSIHPTLTRVLSTTIINFICIYYYCFVYYYYIGGPLKLIQIADCNNANCHPTKTKSSDDGS